VTGRSRLARRLLLTLVATVALAATAYGLATAGANLRFTNARPSLTVLKTPRPVPVRAFAPGDRAERLAVIRNRGTTTVRRVRFELPERGVTPGRVVRAPRGRATPRGFRWLRECRTVRVTGRDVRRCRTVLRRAPSPLVTDRNGLRVVVEVCSRPWRRVAGAGPRYRCVGRMRRVVSSRRVPTRIVMRGLPAIRPGGRAYVRMTVSLPPAAGNALQRLGTTLVPRYTVLGAR
jgi:hypothetical protein